MPKLTSTSDTQQLRNTFRDGAAEAAHVDLGSVREKETPAASLEKMNADIDKYLSDNGISTGEKKSFADREADRRAAPKVPGISA